MKEPREIDKEFYARLDEVARIGQRAVHAAQAESRRMGVTNVYSINGILHWELPNGELTTKDPLAGSDSDAVTSKDSLPRSLGSGRSERGDISERAEELLDGMGDDS